MLNVIIFCMYSTIATPTLLEVATSFNSDYPFTNAEGWTMLNRVTNTFTICGGSIYFFGGFEGCSTESSIMKQFTLMPHYRLKIMFSFIIIDDSQGESVYLFVDSQQQIISFPVGDHNFCGNSNVVDKLMFFIYEFDHTSPTATIIFQSPVRPNVFWGMKGFSLSIYTCPKGCQICRSGQQFFECFDWKLVYSVWNSYLISDFSDEGWVQNQVGIPTECGGVPIYGGYQSMTRGSELTKTLRLPHHNKLTIFFKIFRIDLWQGEQIIMLVDQIQVLSSSHTNTYIKNVCGGAQSEMVETFQIEVSHTSSTATIYLTNNLIQSSDRFYGIRDFQIYIQNSGDSCGNGFLDDNEQCDDGNNVPFDGCFLCQYSCCEGCSNCVRGGCQFCRDGWIYDINSQKCYQEFRSNVILKVDGKERSIQSLNYLANLNCNEIFMNQCLKCEKGWQPSESGLCVEICGDGLIVGNEQCEFYQKHCNNVCQLTCQSQCINCQFGQCIQCVEGYQSINGQCQPICNDKLIQIDEQCDDDNNITFDGCYQCQNQCQESCLDCNKGQCMICNFGWILNKGVCESTCGDSIIAKGNEECDDGNNIKLDGCYNCNLECIENCNVCFLGICYECQEPYGLSNQKCQILCGDGFISKGFEQCDDGNDIPYDGCYNCEFQCHQNCQNCQYGQCIDICEYGYYMINQQCVSICSDGIVASNEQCDDQNDLPNDGCYQCQYQCVNNCKICESGTCEKCFQGYELYNGQCISACGDGKMASNNEECDDFNDNNQDGCNLQCQIEINWICQTLEDSFSECTYNQPPNMQLIYLKQEFAYQYVKLSFTQKIMSQVDNFTQFINVTVLNLNTSITLIEVNPINSTLKYAEYIIQIQFSQQIDYKPILQVYLLEDVFNVDYVALENQNQTIKLQEPLILSEKELQVSENIQQINEIILFSSCGLCLILICLGNLSLFFEILDILQQQSFLKYLNVNIPQNLYIYFESSNALTFQPILNFLKVDQLSNQILNQPFIEAKYKFREYEINADIFQNIQAQLLMIIFSITLRLILNCVIKLLFKLQINTKETLKLKIYSKVMIYLTTFYKEIIQQGFKFMVYANSFDLLFASILQLSVNSDYQRNVLSISIICGIFSVALMDNKPQMIITLKKATFILILVSFQSSQIIQTVLLGLIYAFYLAFISNKDSFKTILNFKNLIPELSMFLYLIAESIHWQMFTIYLNYQTRVITGWVQLGILSSALLLNLIIEAYHNILTGLRKLIKYLFDSKKPQKAQMPLEMIAH